MSRIPAPSSSPEMPSCLLCNKPYERKPILVKLELTDEENCPNPLPLRPPPEPNFNDSSAAVNNGDGVKTFSEEFRTALNVFRDLVKAKKIGRGRKRKKLQNSRILDYLNSSSELPGESQDQDHPSCDFCFMELLELQHLQKVIDEAKVVLEENVAKLLEKINAASSSSRGGGGGEKKKWIGGGPPPKVKILPQQPSSSITAGPSSTAPGKENAAKEIQPEAKASSSFEKHSSNSSAINQKLNSKLRPCFVPLFRVNLADCPNLKINHKDSQIIIRSQLVRSQSREDDIAIDIIALSETATAQTLVSTNKTRDKLLRKKLTISNNETKSTANNEAVASCGGDGGGGAPGKIKMTPKPPNSYLRIETLLIPARISSAVSASIPLEERCKCVKEEENEAGGGLSLCHPLTCANAQRNVICTQTELHKCKNDGEKLKSWLADGKPYKVYVKRAFQYGKGHRALFAGTSMEANDIVGSYTGIVHGREEYRQRLEEGKCQGGYAAWLLNKSFLCCAEFTGEVTRFANHTCGDDNANCQLVERILEGEVFLLMMTNRAVKKDEELLLNYSKCFYWVDDVEKVMVEDQNNIEKGEELSFLYSSTFLSRFNVVCRCSSENCVTKKSIREGEKLEKEMKRNKAREAATTFCRECNKRFSTSGNLKAHMKEVHGGGERVKCEECLKDFSSKKSYKIHKKTIHAEAKYECQSCKIDGKKEFMFRDGKRHRRLWHRMPYKIICKCGRSFNSRQALSYHRKKCNAYVTAIIEKIQKKKKNN